MQSLPFPSYLVPPRSKYSQHHVLKHPQLTFLPQYQRTSFTPIQNNKQNYTTLILLTWRIWWASNNDRRWQMGFNFVLKELTCFYSRYYRPRSETTYTDVGYKAQHFTVYQFSLRHRQYTGTKHICVQVQVTYGVNTTDLNVEILGSVHPSCVRKYSWIKMCKSSLNTTLSENDNQLLSPSYSWPASQHRSIEYQNYF